MKLFITITGAIIFSFFLIAGSVYYFHARHEAQQLQADCAELALKAFNQIDKPDLESNNADTREAAKARVLRKIGDLKNLTLSSEAKKYISEMEFSLSTTP